MGGIDSTFAQRALRNVRINSNGESYEVAYPPIPPRYLDGIDGLDLSLEVAVNDVLEQLFLSRMQELISGLYKTSVVIGEQKYRLRVQILRERMYGTSNVLGLLRRPSHNKGGRSKRLVHDVVRSLERTLIDSQAALISPEEIELFRRQIHRTLREIEYLEVEDIGDVLRRFEYLMGDMLGPPAASAGGRPR